MLNNLKMLKQFQYFFHSRVPLGPLTPHKSWLIPGSVFFMTFSSPTRHRALFVLGETFRPLNETANKVDRNVYGSEGAERAKSSPGKKVQKPGEYWPQLINLKLKLLSRRDCLPINPHRTGFFAAIGNVQRPRSESLAFIIFFPPFCERYCIAREQCATKVGQHRRTWATKIHIFFHRSSPFAPHLADFATFGFKPPQGSSLAHKSRTVLALRAIDIWHGIKWHIVGNG